MKLYGGIDLHSNNCVVVLLDEEDRVVYEKRLPNDLGYLLLELAPYQGRVDGVVVESTFNGYWLVDGLMEAGKRDGHLVDIPALMAECLESGHATASALADHLLFKALELDANRPSDDMSALVLAIFPSPLLDSNRINPQVRRMEIHIPL